MMLFLLHSSTLRMITQCLDLYLVKGIMLLSKMIFIIFFSGLNKLPLNLSKYSVLHMTRSKSNYYDTYIMGDDTLVEVDEIKLLGVTFSKDLSFDSHIDAISNKVSKLSGFITRCTRSRSSYTLFNLYKALFLPNITYCACVWAPHLRNHLDRLEKVQRKITRTLFFKQFPNADVRPPYSNRFYWFRYSQGWGCSQNSKADSGFQDFAWFGPCFFCFLHSAQQTGEY